MDDICDADTVLAFVGIGYSDDKLLQTRIFSYADTQRHRLGPNYLLLPVNAPKCPHHNNHHDGFMNFMHRDEEVSLLHLPLLWRCKALILLFAMCAHFRRSLPAAMCEAKDCLNGTLRSEVGFSSLACFVVHMFLLCPLTAASMNESGQLP